MNIIFIILIIILAFILTMAHIIIVKGIFYAILNSKILKEVNNLSSETEVVLLHTYCPKNSIVPIRGQKVAKKAYHIAKLLQAPIVLTVGHTVPVEERTEAEIYRDYIYENLGNDVEIILGNDPNVRDTLGETLESIKIMKQYDFKTFVRIATTPHLIFRIMPLWSKMETPSILSHFIGVNTPKYYLWEITMMIIEDFINLLPKKLSLKTRNFLLDMGNRKG